MNFDFLHRNVGNRLTPELAQGLYNSFQGLLNDAYKDAFNDAARKLAELEGGVAISAIPETCMGYQFRLGDYASELEQIEPLQRLHLAEVETARDPRLAFQADQDGMIRLARTGRMHVFLICTGMAPVGYMTMQFHRDHGTSLLIGSEFHFFIHKDHRKGWLALRFIRWIETTLKGNGVSEMRAGVRDVKDVSVIYRRLGFSPFAHLFSKVL